MNTNISFFDHATNNNNNSTSDTSSLINDQSPISRHMNDNNNNNSVYSPFCESVIKLRRKTSDNGQNDDNNSDDTKSDITTSSNTRKKKVQISEEELYLKRALRKRKQTIEEAELGLDPNEQPPVVEALMELPPTEMVASLVPCSSIEFLREVLDEGLEPDEFVETMFEVFRDAYPQYLDSGNEKLEAQCKNQIRVFFSEVDANDNGNVDWEEFSTHLLVNTRGAPTDKPHRAMERSLLQVERDSGYDPPPPGRKMSVFHLNTQPMHAIRFMRGGPPPATYSPAWGCHIIAQDRNVEFGIASEVEMNCYKLNTMQTPSHPLATAHLMTVSERAKLHRKLELVATSVIPQRICAMEPLDEQSYPLSSDGSLIRNQRRPYLAATTSDDRLLYIELQDDPLTLMTKGCGQLRVVRDQYFQGKHNILRWNSTGRYLAAVDTRGKIKLLDPSDTSSALPKEKLSFYGGGGSSSTNNNTSGGGRSSGSNLNTSMLLRTLSPKSRLKARRQILKKISYPGNQNNNNGGDDDEFEDDDHRDGGGKEKKFNNNKHTSGTSSGSGAVLDLVTMPEMASCDKVIVAGSDAIRMFDTARGGEILHQLGERIYATKLAYSANTSIVAACVADDADIHLLSPHSAGKSSYVRSLHDPVMTSGTLRALPRHVVALEGTPYLTSYDTAGVVRLWDLRSSVPVCSFRSTGEDASMYVDTAETLPLCITRGISIDPERMEVAAVSRTVDGTRQDSFRMQLTDARDPLDAHDNDVLSVAFVDDMHQIASMANDDTLHFWDGQSCVLRRRIKEFVNGDGETATVPGKTRRPVSACCIELPNGRRTMVGLATGEVIMYSTVTRCEIAEFQAHASQVVDLSLTLSERLISAGADGIIYISSTNEDLDYRLYASINLDNPIVQISADPICQLIFVLDSSCKFYQVDADPDGAYTMLSASRAIHAPSATASASMYSSSSNSHKDHINHNTSTNRPDTAQTNITSGSINSRPQTGGTSPRSLATARSNNNNKLQLQLQQQQQKQKQDDSSNALETEYLNPTNFEGTCCTLCSPRAAAVVADARGYLSVIPTRPSGRHGELYLCRWRSHSSTGTSGSSNKGGGGGGGGDIRGATLSVPTKLIYVEEELALYVGDDQGNVSVYFMRGTWSSGKIGVVQSMFGLEDDSIPKPSHTDPPTIQDEFASRPKLLRHFSVTEEGLPISTMAYVASKDLLIVASRTKIRLVRPNTGELIGDVAQGRCVNFESFAGAIDLGAAPERDDDDDDNSDDDSSSSTSSTSEDDGNRNRPRRCGLITIHENNDDNDDDDDEYDSDDYEYYTEEIEEVDEVVRDPLASLEKRIRMKQQGKEWNPNQKDDNEENDEDDDESGEKTTIKVMKKRVATIKKLKKGAKKKKNKNQDDKPKRRSSTSSTTKKQQQKQQQPPPSSSNEPTSKPVSRPESAATTASATTGRSNNKHLSASTSFGTSLQRFNASVRRMSRSIGDSSFLDQLSAKEEILKKDFESMLSTAGAPETFVKISREAWEQTANQLRPYAMTMKGCGDIDLNKAKSAEAAAAKVSFAPVKSPRPSPTRADQYKKNTHRVVGLQPDASRAMREKVGAGIHRDMDSYATQQQQQQQKDNDALVLMRMHQSGVFGSDDEENDDDEEDEDNAEDNIIQSKSSPRRISNVDEIESESGSSSSDGDDHKQNQRKGNDILKPTFASFATPTRKRDPQNQNQQQQQQQSTSNANNSTSDFKPLTSPSFRAALHQTPSSSFALSAENNNKNKNALSISSQQSAASNQQQQQTQAQQKSPSLLLSNSSSSSAALLAKSQLSQQQSRKFTNTNMSNYNKSSAALIRSSTMLTTSPSSIAGGGSGAFGGFSNDEVGASGEQDEAQRKFISMLNDVAQTLRDELTRDGVLEKAASDDFWWNSDPLYRQRRERHEEFYEEMEELKNKSNQLEYVQDSDEEEEDEDQRSDSASAASRQYNDSFLNSSFQFGSSSLGRRPQSSSSPSSPSSAKKNTKTNTNKTSRTSSASPARRRSSSESNNSNSFSGRLSAPPSSSSPQQQRMTNFSPLVTTSPLLPSNTYSKNAVPPHAFVASTTSPKNLDHTFRNFGSTAGSVGISNSFSVRRDNSDNHDDDQQLHQISLPPALTQTDTKSFQQPPSPKKSQQPQQQTPPRHLAAFSAFDMPMEVEKNDNNSSTNQDDEEEDYLKNKKDEKEPPQHTPSSLSRGAITFSGEYHNPQQSNNSDDNKDIASTATRNQTPPFTATATSETTNNSNNNELFALMSTTPVSALRKTNSNVTAGASAGSFIKKSTSFVHPQAAAADEHNRDQFDTSITSRPLLAASGGGGSFIKNNTNVSSNSRRLTRRKSSFSVAAGLQQSRASDIVVFRRPLLYPLNKPRENTINAVVNGSTNYSTAGGWIDRLEATIAERGLSNPQLPSRDVIKQIRKFSSWNNSMLMNNNNNNNHDDETNILSENPRIWVVPKTSIIEVEHDPYRFGHHVQQVNNNVNNNSITSPTGRPTSASSISPIGSNSPSPRRAHSASAKKKLKKANEKVLKRVRFNQHQTKKSPSPPLPPATTNSIVDSPKQQHDQKLSPSFENESSSNNINNNNKPPKPEHFGDAEWEIFQELEMKMNQIKKTTEEKIHDIREKEDQQARLEQCRSSTFASLSSGSFTNTSATPNTSSNNAVVDSNNNSIMTMMKLPAALAQHQEEQQQKQLALTAILSKNNNNITTSSSSIHQPPKTPPSSLRVLSSVLESRTMSATERRRRTGILKFLPERDLIDAEEKQSQKHPSILKKKIVKHHQGEEVVEFTNTDDNFNNDVDDVSVDDNKRHDIVHQSSSPLIAFRSRVGQSVPPAGIPSAPRQLFTMPMSIEQEVAKKKFDGWGEAKKGRLSERAMLHEELQKKEGLSKNTTTPVAAITKRGPRVSLAKERMK